MSTRMTMRGDLGRQVSVVGVKDLVLLGAWGGAKVFSEAT